MSENQSGRTATTSSPYSRFLEFVAKMMPRAAFVLFLIVLISFTSALPEPAMTAEEIRQYTDANGHYFLSYDPPYLGAEYIKQYSHLSVVHAIEQEALEHAQQEGLGPFYVGEARNKKALYVSTQIRGDSRLGRKWNLRQYIDGRLSAYDAHAFWRVNRRGAKLLRLDLWPAGARVQEAMTMEDAHNRFKRPRWGCC